MADDMDRLERDVEREFATLAGVFVAAPRPECVARVKLAVGRESQRQRRASRIVAALRTLGAAAAVFILAVTVGPFGDEQVTDPLPALGANPAGDFAAWVTALDESEQQIAQLMNNEWILDGSGVFGEDDEQVDPLGNLEESLESFERMIGT